MCQDLGLSPHSPLRPDDVLSTFVTAAGASAGVANQSGYFFYLKDTLGTVTDILNSAGNIVQRYDYSVFGILNSIKDASGTDISSSAPFRGAFTFTGRELDDESGLYYYRARYYDAFAGRFMQKDPHPGELDSPSTIINSYKYADNNPAMITDPNGKFWWVLAFALLGAAQGYYAGVEAGLSGWSLVWSSLLGAVTSVAAPVVANSYGIVAGLIVSAAAGGAYQAGMQSLAYGKVVNWDFVAAAAGSAFVGATLGLGAAKYSHFLGLTDYGATQLDNALGLGGGALGIGLNVPTPSRYDVDRYRGSIRVVYP